MLSSGKQTISAFFALALRTQASVEAELFSTALSRHSCAHQGQTEVFHGFLAFELGSGGRGPAAKRHIMAFPRKPRRRGAFGEQSPIELL